MKASSLNRVAWTLAVLALAGAGEIFVEGFECGFLNPWFDVVR